MDIKSSLTRLWVWRKHNYWGWVESVFLTLMILGCCFYLNPKNPLFVKEIFPWPWIASVMIVFQYGLGPSLLTIAVLALFAVQQRDLGLLSVVDFQAYLLSGTTLILLCALFSSSWARRVMNAEALEAYNQERLKSLSRSYYMLRLSSDYLEQNIITKPVTLRMALNELQKLNLNHESSFSKEVALSFLQIISQFCSVNAAAIYLYKEKGVSLKPLARIGAIGALVVTDPLVKKCMDLNQICYVSIKEIENVSDCTYLVAVPVGTSGQKPLGLLVIKEIPFWNLTDETLRVFSILTYYFSEEVLAAPDETNFLKVYPNCTIDFVKQLTKLLLLKRDMDIDSVLVAVMVPKELRHHSVLYNLKNQHRLLDFFWSFETKTTDVLITLMPFTSEAGVYGYVARVKKYLSSELGLDLEEQNIKMRSIMLYKAEPITVMKYFMNFIGAETIE